MKRIEFSSNAFLCQPMFLFPSLFFVSLLASPSLQSSKCITHSGVRIFIRHNTHRNVVQFYFRFSPLLVSFRSALRWMGDQPLYNRRIFRSIYLSLFFFVGHEVLHSEHTYTSTTFAFHVNVNAFCVGSIIMTMSHRKMLRQFVLLC